MSLPDVKSKYDGLVREVSPKVLRMVLQAQAGFENKLVDNFVKDKVVVSERCWFQEQRVQLLETPIALEDWDVTLLAAVIQRTFDDSLSQIKNYVKAVKDMRNKLMHSPGNTISTEKATENWDYLRKVIDDLVTFTQCQKEVQKEVNNHIRRIQYGYFRDDLAKVESTWKEDDRKFVETRASRKVQELLKDRDAVTIVGESGSGKSGIAHHVAIQLEAEGYTIYPVSKADHVAQLEDANGKQVFVFDDPVGTFKLEGHTLNEFRDSHDKIMSIIGNGKGTGKNKKVIVTCRNEVFNHDRIREEQTLIGEGLIDLSSEEFVLTRSEKERMLNAHIERRRISNQERNETIEIDCPNCPILCQLFAINRYQKTAKEFFSKDVSNSLKKLLHTQRKGKTTYEDVALLLCVLFDNSFDISWLDKHCALKEYKEQIRKTTEILEDCKMSKKNDRNAIVQALQSSTFFRRDGNRFRCLHDAVYDAAACYISKCHPTEVLKYCSSAFIHERVRTESISPIAIHEIVVNKVNYGDLVERFYSDLSHGLCHEVFTNPSFEDKTFVEKFIDYTEADMERSAVNDVYMNVCTLDTKPLDSVIGWSKNWFVKFLLSQANTRAIHWLVACPSKHTHMLFDACFPALKGELQLVKNLLAVACVSGNAKIVNKVLQHCDADASDIPTDCEELGLNLLHLAAVSGKAETVKILVDKKVDINSRTKSHCTPLYMLAAMGHAPHESPARHTSAETSALFLLLENKADINAIDIDGKSPLFAAAQNGHSTSVSALLSHNADSNLCDSDSKSPLHAAAANGHSNSVSALLSHKADSNLCDSDSKSPLHAAAANGHSNSVSALLAHNADSNLCDKRGGLPLHGASQNGHTAIISLLLDHENDTSAVINALDSDGKSPLFVAAENGHSETVVLLLEHTADVNVCDSDSRSPLHAAAANGHSDAVSKLLQKSANSGKRDNSGAVPLHAASQNGHASVVSMLLEHADNTDVNQCDHDKTTPLLAAVANGHFSVVKLLLQHNADVNMCDIDHKAPLYAATENGHSNIVCLLLQHKANSSLCDKKGISPLYVAARDGHTSVVSVLLEYNADPYLRDITGKLPRTVAADRGHTQINRILWQHMIKQSVGNQV